MAIYDEALQYIIDDTGRPEMAEVMKRRIQRAALAMHRIDFWKRDFLENIHVFTNSQAVQIINLNQYPRIRAVAYIRQYNADAASLQDPTIFDGAVGSFFGEINPQMAMDGYGYDKVLKMYRTQDAIKLVSDAAIQQVLFARFIDPILNPIDSMDSWIVRDYPTLIAAHAKRRIFKDIGKDEEYRSADEEFKEELLLLQANNIRLAVLQMPG